MVTANSATSEDGGVFTSYDKPFVSLGLVARVDFTGAALPKTNSPAALVVLSSCGSRRQATATSR